MTYPRITSGRVLTRAHRRPGPSTAGQRRAAVDTGQIVAWLGLLGAAATIGARLVYAAYYSAIGVSPDEVDLTPGRLLVVTGTVVVAVAGLVAGAAAVGGWFATRWHRRGRGVVVPGAVVAATAYVAIVEIFRPLPAMWLFIPAAVLGATVLVVAPLHVPLSAGDGASRARRWAMGGAAATVVGLWAVAFAGASAAARTDRQSWWTGPRHGLAAMLLYPDIRHVCPVPITAGVRGLLPKAGVLLAATAGQDVLINPDGRVWRIPQSVVALPDAPANGCL